METLKEENSSLRDELEHMREECQKLAAENTSLTVSSDLCFTVVSIDFLVNLLFLLLCMYMFLWIHVSVLNRSSLSSRLH